MTEIERSENQAYPDTLGSGKPHLNIIKNKKDNIQANLDRILAHIMN